MKRNPCAYFLVLLLVSSCVSFGNEAKVYHETSTPRLLPDWRESSDGKISVCFAVDKTTFRIDEPITVRCVVKNMSDNPLTIMKPFGDSFFVQSSGLNILGPEGAIPYRGAHKDYVLGTSSFLVLPPHYLVDETFTLPAALFPGLGKAGLYTIGYTFLSDNYPKRPVPENFWQGLIKPTPLTIVVK